MTRTKVAPDTRVPTGKIYFFAFNVAVTEFSILFISLYLSYSWVSLPITRPLSMLSIHLVMRRSVCFDISISFLKIFQCSHIIDSNWPCSTVFKFWDYFYSIWSILFPFSVCNIVPFGIFSWYSFHTSISWFFVVEYY